jgi:hypothetical protein
VTVGYLILYIFCSNYICQDFNIFLYLTKKVAARATRKKERQQRRHKKIAARATKKKQQGRHEKKEQ